MWNKDELHPGEAFPMGCKLQRHSYPYSYSGDPRCTDVSTATKHRTFCTDCKRLMASSCPAKHINISRFEFPNRVAAASFVHGHNETNLNLRLSLGYYHRDPTCCHCMATKQSKVLQEFDASYRGPRSLAFHCQRKFYTLFT